MNWRSLLGVLMVAGSAAWYYFYVRPQENQQLSDLQNTAAAKQAAVGRDQKLADGTSSQDNSETSSSTSAVTPYGYDQQETAAIESATKPELAQQISKLEFRELPPEKQMMVKEVLARQIAKGDGSDMTDLMKQIDTGAASESADLFETMTMSTGVAAAKVLIDLAFNATNEDVRKKALAAVSHIYKSRGNKRTPIEVTKIEQYLVAALGRADLADREFSAIIQSLAGFGTAYGIQTIVDLWEGVTAIRQEIIANEIKIIFQKTAVVPLSACVLSHKQLWKSCGLSLAMIGSEESILAILRAVPGSPEKKVESLIWFQSVNKIPAIKALLADAKANEEKDKEYFSQVRALAESLLDSLQPISVPKP